MVYTMTKRKFVAVIVFFFLLNNAYSQTSKWENFTDLKNITSIESDNVSGKIYCSSTGGLFVLEAATGKVVNKYTNLNGLIINDLTSLAIDNNRKLWIGASDGSLSILNLQDLSWKYIFDIKNSSESNKAINFLYPIGNLMFAATGYGIQKISIINFNFIDAPYYKLGSFPTNGTVYSLTSNNNVLYAATKYGVAYANFVSSNLNNPATWTNHNDSPLTADVKTIETFDNKIFAGALTGFAYFDGSKWRSYPNASVSTQNIKYIKASGDKIYFISGNSIYFSTSSNLETINSIPGLPPNNYTTLDYNNNFGLIAGLADKGISLNTGIGYNFYFPNSPYTNSFNQIVIDDNNNIWVAGGNPNSGFYKFDGQNWQNFTTINHPEIGNSNWFQKIAFGYGKIWALGYGGGPTIVIDSNNIINFNPTNSILPGISIAAPNFCATYGGAYDNNQVFWLTFILTVSNTNLFAYDQHAGWIGFINPAIIGASSLSEVAVDSYNTKWIVSSGSRAGLYFFNENGTLTDQTDDVFGYYDHSDFGSEVGYVTDVIVEKNNEVWAATNNGVFIINDPLAAVQNPNQKPRPQKLGIIFGNLKVPFTENCLTITNDILNDKWIGTQTNGVFHLSSDGSTLIEQFNTSNSPILSNSINTIAVSTKTGRAFFGSQQGLSSYSTDAIEPVQDFTKIIVSPNPYLIPSGVSLKIDGLIENSIIKIITLSGEVVREFDSPGGRIAFWDGRNKKNELASTGIYIIVAYNKDGSKVGTGKVAIVNK